MQIPINYHNRATNQSIRESNFILECSYISFNMAIVYKSASYIGKIGEFDILLESKNYLEIILSANEETAT